jgi:hypothetical protein
MEGLPGELATTRLRRRAGFGCGTRARLPDPREITEGTWPDRQPPYPPVDKTDAVQAEPRSFDPAADAPSVREPPSDACPASMTDGRMGPGGDPAEGKR